MNADFSHVACQTYHKRKGFLHRIVTGDEKWIHYDNKEEEIMEITWLCFNIDSQAEYSWKKTHVMYLVVSLVYYVAQTERDHYWGFLPNTIDEIEPSKEKRAHYYSRDDKIILLHDNA